MFLSHIDDPSSLFLTPFLSLESLKEQKKEKKNNSTATLGSLLSVSLSADNSSTCVLQKYQDRLV